MTGPRPGSSPSGKGVPPTSRRSARQQRIAGRQSRALERAGTGGKPSSSGKWLIGATVAALAVAAVVLALAYLNTKQPTHAPVGSPLAPAFTTAPDITRNGNVLGNPDAPVTLDLYSDYQCPRCFDFAKITEPKLIDEYIRSGKLKLVYHDLIIIDSGKAGSHESRDAANAALCAGDQGKYWTMHDWLFSNQSLTENSGGFTKSRLVEMGRLAGLDMAKFQPCVEQDKHVSEIETAQGAVPSGVSGTPSIFVNNVAVEGATDSSTGQKYIPTYDQMKAAIDKALNPSASQSPSPSPSPSASPSSSASPSPSASPSAAPTASPS